MPEERTKRRAARDKAQGKSSLALKRVSSCAEEIEHVREGKHGARSSKQAIAIGLSKARRAGVDLPPPKASAQFRAHTSRVPPETANAGSQRESKKTIPAPEPRNPGGARARTARRCEPAALSRQAHASARRRAQRREKWAQKRQLILALDEERRKTH